MNNRKLYIITLLLIPIFIVSIIYNSLDKKELKTNNITTKKQETAKANIINKDIKIKINKNNEILELNLEEYII